MAFGVAGWAGAELPACFGTGADDAAVIVDLGVWKMNGFPAITVLTFAPLALGLIVAGVSAQRKDLARGLTLISSLLSLGLAVWIWKHFDSASTELQFLERGEWVPTLGIQYFVAVDGLGLLMILLTSLVVPMTVLASWRVEEKAPLYFSLILFLQAGLFGTFTALNFFHWFIFWELSLIPAFFLIKLWGGPARTKAAYQFVVYTMVGSVTMLLAFLAIYAAVGTFDFAQLADLARTNGISTALFAKLGGSFWKTKQSLAALIFFGAF